MVRALALCSLIFLGGCSTLVSNVKPDVRARMLEDFQAGSVIFDCSITCAHSYIFHQDEIILYYRASDWENLAVALIDAGWRQDITYFLLGVAAEKQGYYAAADRYFRIAGALAVGEMQSEKCASVSGLCGPFVLPQDAVRHLKVVDKALAGQQQAQARAYAVYNSEQRGSAAQAGVISQEYELCRRFSESLAQSDGTLAAAVTCRDANGDWHTSSQKP